MALICCFLYKIYKIVPISIIIDTPPRKMRDPPYFLKISSWRSNNLKAGKYYLNIFLLITQFSIMRVFSPTWVILRNNPKNRWFYSSTFFNNGTQKTYLIKFGVPPLFFSAQFVYKTVKQFIFNCLSLAYVNNN